MSWNIKKNIYIFSTELANDTFFVRYNFLIYTSKRSWKRSNKLRTLFRIIVTYIVEGLIVCTPHRCSRLLSVSGKLFIKMAFLKINYIFLDFFLILNCLFFSCENGKDASFSSHMCDIVSYTSSCKWILYYRNL